MKKPARLHVGAKIATIALSAGLAGEPAILWRYEQGKRQLQALGFEVVEMPHTLGDVQSAYEDPQGRARDLEQALLDPEIKAILSTIGGSESYRIFQHVDLQILREHPKPFIGYSDSTSVHQLFRMAGVGSFYGPCLLVDFAENGGVSAFTREVFEAVLMADTTGYVYPWRENWTSEFLPWEIANQPLRRQFQPDRGPLVLQGKGQVTGRLLGGCLEVLAMLRGTPLYPTPEDFAGALLLLETSEEMPVPDLVERELRTMGIMGNLSRVNGILFGKPQEETYFQEYQDVIQKVLREFDLPDLPVVYNCNFGHTEPKWTLPLGVAAKLDLEAGTLTLLESATSE